MTSPDSSLRVAEEIERELYLGVTIDGFRGCPIVMVSSEGGVEIEETAWICSEDCGKDLTKSQGCLCCYMWPSYYDKIHPS